MNFVSSFIVLVLVTYFIDGESKVLMIDYIILVSADRAGVE